MFEDDLYIVHSPRIKHLWDVTNFIDIMIVLLIFLVGTTTFSKVGITLDQPNSSTASPVPPYLLEIDLTSDGITYVDQKKVDSEQLTAHVRETLKKDANMVISIRTDKKAMTQALFDVVDICREAGGTKFSFGAVRK